MVSIHKFLRDFPFTQSYFFKLPSMSIILTLYTISFGKLNFSISTLKDIFKTRLIQILLFHSYQRCYWWYLYRVIKELSKYLSLGKTCFVFSFFLFPSFHLNYWTYSNSLIFYPLGTVNHIFPPWTGSWQAQSQISILLYEIYS